MQERRHHKRFTVDIMDINGTIIFGGYVKILNISLGGVLLKVDRRLNIGRNYLLKLEGKGMILTVKGTVLRCILSESRRNQKGEIIPIYTTAMKFTDLSNDKIVEITNFIKEHFVDYQKQEIYKPVDLLKNRGLRLYVRFIIDAPEKSALHLQDVYKVKTISNGGMLMESEHALEIDDTIPMKMTLPVNRIIKFWGRIISCRSIINSRRGQYEIGVEFIEMSKRDREVLQEFISSLEEINKGSYPGS
jgi:c-di-GMP-binding flagellar brake protein YcgR